MAITSAVAAAEALTNPPDITALGNLLGRLALARLDPLPARQVLADIKAATGIPMAILEKQLAELRRRVNASGDPNAPHRQPALVQPPASGSRRAHPSATRPMSSSR